MRGMTLPELLLVLLITSASVTLGLPHLQRLAQEQRVNASTRDLLHMINLARAEGLVHGEVRLCDAHHRCQRFLQTDKLEVIKGNPEHATDADVLATLPLPPGITVRWRRFRGHALWFHKDGRSHYQNGTFIICNQVAARQIVLNWAGRPRVEPAQPDELC